MFGSQDKKKCMKENNERKKINKNLKSINYSYM